MIQRIQSIYLLVAGLLLFGLFLFPYVHYNDLLGLGKDVKVTGVYGVSAGQPVHEGGFLYILQTIVTVVVGLLPIFIIFKYKNRKTQIKLVFLNIFLVVLLAVGLYVNAGNHLSTVNQFLGASNIGVGFFLLPVSIILLALALGGIRRDEKLIKSADRLR